MFWSVVMTSRTTTILAHVHSRHTSTQTQRIPNKKITTFQRAHHIGLIVKTQRVAKKCTLICEWLHCRRLIGIKGRPGGNSAVTSRYVEQFTTVNFRKYYKLYPIGNSSLQSEFGCRFVKGSDCLVT